MTILQSLAALYDRLERRGETIPKQGYAPVRIAFILELATDGHPLRLIDIRDHSQRRPAGQVALMPAIARTSGIKPAFFWDKTAYVFGVTAIERDGRIVAGQSTRTLEEHHAFRHQHIEVLQETADEGLQALSRFLQKWSPGQWIERGFPADALDLNIAFRLKGDSGRIDERDAAKRLVKIRSKENSSAATCLATGEVKPYVLLQPQLKGVVGAQSSGAPLVSFNADAFQSYGHKEGANAPVCEEAAFKYGAALNWLLERTNSHSFRLGESTVVFWVGDSDGDDSATAIEDTVRSAFASSVTGDGMVHPIRLLHSPDMTGAKVHILGLSPNSGRIAVRLWFVDTFSNLMHNLQRHNRDMEISPRPQTFDQKASDVLSEFAARGKPETIPARLSGEFAQAILAGAPYPRTLLANLIRRVRADHSINAHRAALCKAIVNRSTDEEAVPVTLDPSNTNPAYRLGRLFALIEGTQKAAHPGIEATVKDRYFAAACTTPARVFPMLHKNTINHVASLRRSRGPHLAKWIEKEISSIWMSMSDDFPRTLTLEEQGRFIAGYYHQRFTKYADALSQDHCDLAQEAKET